MEQTHERKSTQYKSYKNLATKANGESKNKDPDASTGFINIQIAQYILALATELQNNKH